MLTRRYLETEIINHCNLACMECSHHSPHMAHGGYPLDEFTRDVHQLAKVMRVKEFRLLGGEPLLSENLTEYVSAIRQSGLAESIGICTNGILLRKVDEKIFDQLDMIDVSFYPVEPPIRKVIENNIARLKEYDQKKITINTINQFRITSQVFENPDKALVNNIWDHCWVKDKSHAVYRGYYFKCVTSQRKGNFLTQMNGSCDPRLLIPETDGVSIYADDFPENLIKYLGSTTHLVACNWCMGTSGKLVDNVQNKHNQHTIKDIKELRSSLIIGSHPSIYSRLRVRAARLRKGFKDLLAQMRRQARTALR